MAFTLSQLSCLTLILLGASLVQAGLQTFNFTVGWVLANPDGQYVRPVMGINGHWPVPTMYVNKGDRVIVNVHNQLGNQSTSLHFHGLYQNGTTHMDGPVGVTQCGIPPGKSFTYDFEVQQAGTYWYHSHTRAQYPDGLRGAFIVHDPENPYADQIDEEKVLTLSDWYHEQMVPLVASFINVANPTGAEPVPQAALMNDTQNLQIHVDPDKTYFFRIVNMAAFAAQYLRFENHTMEIIEVDGVYTERQPAKEIYITAAQRYGVLIRTKKETSQNFAIVGSMDTDLFDTIPPGLDVNVASYLVYNKDKKLPEPAKITDFNPYDDFDLVPKYHKEIFRDPDHIVDITMEMGNLDNGANYAFINDQTYVAPRTPTLYTTLSTGENATKREIYGPYTNTFILGQNQVIEIRMNNNDPGKHPFHLHGHNFQAVYRSSPNAGYYSESKAPESSFSPQPMRRDTFMANPNGFFVLRFRSDNPGIWLYHCHIEWHVASGLLATMIEAPYEIQKQLDGGAKIPKDHYDACKDKNIPIIGNAAGNSKDIYDLAGVPAPPGPLPAGFTASGIVALVFSCISGILGVAVIAWYGAKPITKKS